jgi:hypothetical protein
VAILSEPEFDLDVAHKYFSAQCFNQAWELMDKAGRTPDEDEQMVRLSLASHWHWTQRPDCSATNASVGYWQTSRIYAMLGQADNARRYGRLSLEAGQGEGALPFCVGYAYEALARAESVAGNRGKMAEYLREARRAAEGLPDPDTKKRLLADLDTIG